MAVRYLAAPVFAVLLAAGAMSVPAQAGAHAHCHKAVDAQKSSTAAYQQAMAVMHRDMKKPLSGNPDVDFVRQMIPHHQGAVDMANIQLAYGHDEGLKRFSRWVITAQEIEINAMKQWLRGHDNGAADPQARDYYGPAMQHMHHAMMIPYTGDADADFVRGMIPHHQGAMDMAAIEIANGVNPEIRALAQNIYRAQTAEIAWQRYWLAHRDAHPAFPFIAP